MHPLSEDLPMSAPNHERGGHLGSMGAAVGQVGRGDHNNPLIAVGDWLHHADASACLLTHLLDYSATFPNDTANLQGTKSVDGRACMLSRVRRIQLGCCAFFGKGRRLIHLSSNWCNGLQLQAQRSCIQGLPSILLGLNAPAHYLNIVPVPFPARLAYAQICWQNCCAGAWLRTFLAGTRSL